MSLEAIGNEWGYTFESIRSVLVDGVTVHWVAYVPKEGAFAATGHGLVCEGAMDNCSEGHCEHIQGAWELRARELAEEYALQAPISKIAITRVLLGIRRRFGDGEWVGQCDNTSLVPINALSIALGEHASYEDLRSVLRSLQEKELEGVTLLGFFRPLQTAQ